jgi:hypothetical protein
VVRKDAAYNSNRAVEEIFPKLHFTDRFPAKGTHAFGCGLVQEVFFEMDEQNLEKLEVGYIKSPSGAPSMRGVEVPLVEQSGKQPCGKFEVRCHAGNAGHLEVANESVSVRIGQWVRKEGKQEVWDSLLVECKQQDDGSLAVEVVVFHPDWDEPVRIASLQSRPCGLSPGEAALRCDLEHKQV